MIIGKILQPNIDLSGGLRDNPFASDFLVHVDVPSFSPTHVAGEERCAKIEIYFSLEKRDALENEWQVRARKGKKSISRCDAEDLGLNDRVAA